MTKANEYVVKHWNEYGDFKSKQECYDFLVCCEAYDTSYEIAHESPIEAYETFGFVWMWGCNCDTRHVIEAILDNATVYRNTTPEAVAMEIATNQYEDDQEWYDEMGETAEDIARELMSLYGDEDIIAVDDDVVFRVYC